MSLFCFEFLYFLSSFLSVRFLLSLLCVASMCLLCHLCSTLSPSMSLASSFPGSQSCLCILSPLGLHIPYLCVTPCLPSLCSFVFIYVLPVLPCPSLALFLSPLTISVFPLCVAFLCVSSQSCTLVRSSLSVMRLATCSVCSILLPSASICLSQLCSHVCPLPSPPLCAFSV